MPAARVQKSDCICTHQEVQSIKQAHCVSVAWPSPGRRLHADVRSWICHLQCSPYEQLCSAADGVPLMPAQL